MIANIKKSFNILKPDQYRKLVWLLILMLLVALFETLGIGLLVPYIGVVNSPGLIKESHSLHSIYDVLGFDSPTCFIVALSVALILLFIFKSLLYLFQQYVQARCLLSFQLDIETRLMESYLSREYLFFTEKNSAELYQNIRNVSGIVALVYIPVLTGIAELVVLALIGLFLLCVQPWVTLVVLLISAGIGYVTYWFTRKRAAYYGEEGGRQLIEMNKWIYQSFDGIKEVKILSREGFFRGRSMFYSHQAARAIAKVSLLSSAVRPFVEAVWFCLTVVLVLVAILLGKNGAAMLPTLILLAAAAIRVMPALGRILNSTITIRQASYHVNSVAQELQGVVAAEQEITAVDLDSVVTPPFHHEISFANVAFCYPKNGRQILHDLSFSIKKGQSIAFVGPSGAGKTTVVDLLLGLMEPQSGQIFVDGAPLSSEKIRAWRSNFGYVPQAIYLADDTVRNNIAFGQTASEIDEQGILSSVDQAQLAEVLESLPQGLDTMVGDQGARLSGGQRQRIGIARALYRDPPILVLDEATSALDNETEREVTRAIRSLKGSKTVILIAHRLSTIAHCDMIVFLVDGRIEAIGTYEELMRDCSSFQRFTATSST